MDAKEEQEEALGKEKALLLMNSIKRPRVEDLVPVKSYITKKRKKKPLGMKAFFPTVKNFQGFPVHLCRYEASIGKKVYIPSEDYGQLSKFCPWRDFSFCPSCNLQPCIMVEHQDDIQSAAHDVHWNQKRAEEEGRKACSNLDIVKKAEKQAMKNLRTHFGRDYMKRCNNCVPDCVISGTQKFGQDEFWRY